LIPLLNGDATVFATVHEPLDAVRAAAEAGAPIPSAAQLLTLNTEADPRRLDYFRPVANMQTRALLVRTAVAKELPVTVGPPPDADRWRQLLFEEALAGVRLDSPGARSALADELAGALRIPRERLSRTLNSARTNEIRTAAPKRPNRSLEKSLRALNWLDVELFDHCHRIGG